MKDMVNYLISSEEEEQGFTKVAFTKKPAIKLKGLAFSLQKDDFLYFKDELKYRIAGPVAIPGEIYRKDEDEEYTVTFTVEEIEKEWKKLALNGITKIFNLEHTSEEVPAYVFEVLLVDTKNKVKLIKDEYFLDVPIGTLFFVTQFTDKEYYNKIVKNDQIGYSIEGLFGLKEMEFSDANLHPNCKCEYVNGVLINDEDACDYCKEFEFSKNKKINMNLPEGAKFQYEDKWFIIKDGEAIEYIEKGEEMEEVKEKTEETEIKEEVKEVKAAEEIIVDPNLEQEVSDKEEIIDYTKEEIDIKLEEIYKMIADLQIKIDEKPSIEFEEEMSKSGKYSSQDHLMKFFEDTKKEKIKK